MGQSNTERIKEKLDIVSVVGAYVTLQKAGALMKARCPFHNEKSPSFTVSPVRQTYHCFGCGEHGDMFTFIEKVEGVDFRGALEILAQQAGVELEDERKKPGGGYGRDEKDIQRALHETATQFFEQQLTTKSDVREYLAQRGLSEKTVATFRLGFAEDAWHALLDALQKAGFTSADIGRSGLVVQGERGTYDRFRSRIMFPIMDAQGKVVGFTGRIWKGDEQSAKYVNSPETALYHKSSVLYGFHIAKHHIRPLNCVLIVEGQMDLLTCHQVGYTNAVAISGTALTEEQVRVLSRLSKNVLLALDSDKAGIDATLKSIDKALAAGCDIKVVSFRGKDASEVLQTFGTEEVRACVREATDWCTYILTVVENRAEGDDRKRARLVSELLVPRMNAVADPLERDSLLRLTHERTQLSIEALQEALRTYTPPASNVQRITAPPHASHQSPRRLGTRHIELLFAAMDVNEVREHPLFATWQKQLEGFTMPDLTISDAHTLLSEFPKFEHALHIEEIMRELFVRAEREQALEEIKAAGEALRSAELTGSDEEIDILKKRAVQLHDRLKKAAEAPENA